MSIFNSLGSNYTGWFALQALVRRSNKNDTTNLVQLLEQKYGGKTYLFYKGREAIEYALQSIAFPQGSTVAITGFTCLAVYQAVKNQNLNVCYLDIAEQDLNFTAGTLQQALMQDNSIKAVIVQNTLGYPAAIDAIEKICKAHNIILIEDLAHCVGTVYQDGREAGTVGDIVVFSFSQDKMIDAVSGGGLVVRNQYYIPQKSPIIESIPTGQQIKDRFYPLFTVLIRTFYDIGLGKLLHTILKSIGALPKPVIGQTTTKLHNLPNWYCGLIYKQFSHLSRSIDHRRTIAKIYQASLPESVRVPNQTMTATYLRFPLVIKNRDHLISYAKDHGIHISDIWYDAPIAPKKYLSQTNYTNQCPHAQELSDQIINIPTHKNISKSKAKHICATINTWINTQ